MPRKTDTVSAFVATRAKVTNQRNSVPPGPLRNRYGIIIGNLDNLILDPGDWRCATMLAQNVASLEQFKAKIR